MIITEPSVYSTFHYSRLSKNNKNILKRKIEDIAKMSTKSRHNVDFFQSSEIMLTFSLFSIFKQIYIFFFRNYQNPEFLFLQINELFFGSLFLRG